MKSRDILSKQNRLFYSLAVGSGIVALVIAYLLIDLNPREARRTQPPVKVDLPGDKVNAQDIWLSRIESSSQLLEQKVEYLEQLIIESKQNERSQQKEKADLRQQVALLKSELSQRQVSHLEPAPPAEVFYEEAIEAPPLRAPLLEHVMIESVRSVGHVSQTIPAGTSVKALLVGSLDAPCGVYAATDPQPVKLRILDDGHLPKGVRALLKGGLVIASAHGNISTERVYMRLERLTQVRPSGDFVETVVSGFITGEDGKYGVRGDVVDRSASLVASAAFSGFFSGASSFLQSTVNAQNIKDATCGLPNDLQWNLISEGGLAGTNNALDMLAEYYIHRAEQIQPVIQVNAGRVVDITFTHGAEMGDLNTHQHIKEVRENSRKEPA